MYEAQMPLGQEEVKQLYSHTTWQSPQDDPFAAEVIFQLPTSFLPRHIFQRYRVHSAGTRSLDGKQDPCKSLVYLGSSLRRCFT